MRPDGTDPTASRGRRLGAPAFPPRARRRRIAATAALLPILALAVCGTTAKTTATTTTVAAPPTSSSSSTAATGSTTSSTTTGSTTTTSAGAGVTTTSLPGSNNPEGGLITSKLDHLPDGVHYGYITGIQSGYIESRPTSVIAFDKVVYLTGPAAVAAAHAAGALPPDQNTLPNDYYLSNVNRLVRQLGVSPDVAVTIVRGGSAAPVASDVAGAASTPGLYKIVVANVRGVSTVMSIDGVFLP